jgi:cobalt-zinc-cadmium efflux system membrane fusion protein
MSVTALIKLLIAIGILLYAASLVPTSCTRTEAPKSTLKDAKETTQHTQSSPIPAERHPLRLVGKVSFGEDYSSKVSSPVQGRVVEVRARLGQTVQEGDVLLVIDSPDITAAYADYLKEVSEYHFATRAYQLSKELYDTQALAFKDLKQSENALVKEEAEFHQAQERLLALRVPRSELEKPIEEQKVMGRFELKSSLKGIIVDRTVTPGQWVGNDPSQVLLLVADLDRLQVVAEAYEQDLPQIHVGDSARVTVEAYPDQSFPAQIATIGDLVDKDTRTVKVRAWLNNESHKLKPEMYAKLTFESSMRQ